jgi:hypothetical protein
MIARKEAVVLCLEEPLPRWYYGTALDTGRVGKEVRERLQATYRLAKLP